MPVVLVLIVIVLFVIAVWLGHSDDPKKNKLSDWIVGVVLSLILSGVVYAVFVNNTQGVW